jgi:hypothetical protein
MHAYEEKQLELISRAMHALGKIKELESIVPTEEQVEAWEEKAVQLEDLAELKEAVEGVESEV